VDFERPKQKYKMFLFLFTDTDLIMSRFTGEDIVSAGSFEYKAQRRLAAVFSTLYQLRFVRRIDDSYQNYPSFLIVSEK
jgi:hypothetical protein